MNEIEDTKTEAGERTVNLLPPAIAALKAQKEHTFLKGVEIFQNPYTRERWTDWTFTARVYYRWIPKDAGDAGNRVMKKWGNN